MRILFATQNIPFPTDAGDRLRTRNLIQLLNANYQIYCLFFPKGRRDLKDIETFNAAFSKKLDFSVVLPRQSFPGSHTFHYFTDPLLKSGKVVNSLESLLDKFKPDIVWLDYLFVGQYIDTMRSRGIPVIYGTHNAQSELSKQLARDYRNLTKKLSLKVLAHLHQWHERKFFGLVDHLICVSKEDKLFHQKFVAPEKISVLPNFINLEDYDSVSPVSREFPYLCFVGSMDNLQNQQAIKYFIREIWPSVIAQISELHLVVIGRGAKSDKELRLYQRKFLNIEVKEDVPSVIPYIKAASVSIVPLLHGSGTRLKIIESMACRKAVVSTSIGAEGLGAESGEEILIADNPHDFSALVVRAMSDEHFRNRIGAKARKYVEDNFSFNSVNQLTINMIQNLISR